MTDPALDRGDDTSSFPRPASLTLVGQQAFDGAVRDYATQLAELLDRQAHRQRRPAPVYTTHDVLAAQFAYEERLRTPDDRTDGVRRLALVLLLTAAGLGALAAFTTGITQAALLGLFAAADSAGVLLTWRSRPRPADDR